eukprot:EG_transcript_23841
MLGRLEEPQQAAHETAWPAAPAPPTASLPSNLQLNPAGGPPPASPPSVPAAVPASVPTLDLWYEEPVSVPALDLLAVYDPPRATLGPPTGSVAVGAQDPPPERRLPDGPPPTAAAPVPQGPPEPIPENGGEFPDDVYDLFFCPGPTPGCEKDVAPKTANVTCGHERLDIGGTALCKSNQPRLPASKDSSGASRATGPNAAGPSGARKRKRLL